MALDSLKSLGERAKENGRAIDSQWIAENESNEFYKKTKQNEEIVNNLGLNSMKLDKDLQEQLNRSFDEIQRTSENGGGINLQSVEQEIQTKIQIEDAKKSTQAKVDELYDLLAQIENSTIQQDNVEENIRHR